MWIDLIDRVKAFSQSSRCFWPFLRDEPLKAEWVARPDNHTSYFRPVKFSSTGYFITLTNFIAHWCMKDGSISGYFPVIILNFPPFFLHPINLILPLWPTFCTPCISPGVLKEQAVAPLLTHIPLKRIIYIGQVWDQSNLCGTIEYTNLRSDISLAEGKANCECCWERQRIKHGAAASFDHPFPPFLSFKGPVRSRPADAWAKGPPFLCHQQASRG